MRLLVLQLAVLGICSAGLVNPLIGLYGYVWYSLMRPDALAWSEGMYPHSTTIAIITLLGVWRFVPNFEHWLKNPFVASLLLLQVPIILSNFQSPDPSLCWPYYYQFAKSLLMCLMIPLFVQREHEFRNLMLLMMGCIGFIGVKFGAFGILHGGIHLEYGFGGFMSDNNTLAMALVMTLPMMWYGRDLVKEGWIRLGILGVMFFTIAAIVMSHSRAASLTLFLVYLVFALRSKHKLVLAFVLAFLSLPTFYLVQNTYVKRMRTLENVNEEGSAASRIRYAQAAMRLWADYPLFGVGFGTHNWVRMSGIYLGEQNLKQHVVHNNYLQMAVDSGTFALLILCGQIYGGIYWLGRSVKRMRKHFPDKAAYPLMLQVSLIAFAFCSIFASRTDYDYYYYLIMACGCWYMVENNELMPSLSAAAVQAGDRAAPGPELAPAFAGPVPQWSPAVAGPARTLRDLAPEMTGPIPKGWRRPFVSRRLELSNSSGPAAEAPPGASAPQRPHHKLGRVN